MESQYNTRSPAVKRLMREANELKDATHEFFAQPLEDNLFEWHFTVRGPPESEFVDGYYHGRIILPTEYPMKPPSIIMLTPNGRFEVNKKICLSISGHHPESWQPSWSIRTALLAIIGFMPTEGRGAIGSLDYPADERKRLAFKSQNWCCPSCGVISKLLKTENTDNESADNEAKELAKQICFKGTNSDAAINSNSMPSANSGYESSSSDSPSIADEVSEVRNDIGNEQNARNDEEISEIRQRNVNQHSSNASQAAHVAHVANANLESSSSSSRFITYLIAILSLAIVLLLFRRIFFM